MTDSFRSPRTYVFPVELVAEPDGRFSAWCPVLPGCTTWARSLQGALRNIEEAVEAYVEDLRASGEELPPEVRPLAKTAVTVTL